MVPADDFREEFHISLVNDELLQKNPLDGMIKHIPLNGEEYKVKCEDWTATIVLSREDLINGTPKVLMANSLLMAGIAARTLESEALRLLVNAPAGYFITADTADRKLNSIAANPLDKAGLQKAAGAPRAQVSADETPLSFEPNVLLVGDQDAAIAEELTGRNGAYPNLTLVKSQWLWSKKIRAVPAADWYLAAVSQFAAPLLISFLDGIDYPTVTPVRTKINIFGTGLQVVFPFGVALRDPRTMVRNEG